MSILAKYGTSCWTNNISKSVIGTVAVLTILLGTAACQNQDTALTKIQDKTTESAAHTEPALKGRPNIIVILADDMGYGDIGAYNAQSKIPTPNLDELAKQGVRLTDAHSPSAVCTPTRYSLLTGRYAWRSRLKSGVLWGYAPLLIEDGRATIGSVLQTSGYTTAAVGKWHLGFGNSEPDFFEPGGETGKNSNDDLFGRLSPGPNQVGFDYFFGIPASLDMKPYLYIENESPVPGLDGTLVEPSSQRRYGGDGFWRKGQIAEGFVFEDVLPRLTEVSLDFIREHAQDKSNPFFLYFPLTAPHTPWLATEEFQGSSGAGHYGDFSVQVDHVVGQIMAELDETGIAEDTLLIFTSDNGAHWLDEDISQFGHLANGQLRGQKADIFEGGHRVPFIARWPENIPENTSHDGAITLADLFKTLAAITGAVVPDEAAEDSLDVSSILADANGEIPERAIIHHALDGMYAIRHGKWKLIEGLGSGGFTKPMRVDAKTNQPSYQLYDLESDPKEENNIANAHPDIVDRLVKKLNNIRHSGSSPAH